MKNKSMRLARARPQMGGRCGFTLIETAVAIVVVGLGVAAILVSTAAGSRANNHGKKLTQATFLAQEVREWTLRLPFSDQDPADANNPPGPDGTDPQTFVDDLDDLLGNDRTGVTYDPPRSGTCPGIPTNYLGDPIGDMVGWSQHIDLTWRSQNDLNSIVADGASDLVYVEVTVSRRGEEMIKTGWLVTRKE